MTQAESVALAATRYEQLQALNQLDSFYDYEKGFDQLWTGLGQDVLEKNLGDLLNDPQKKHPHGFLWFIQGVTNKFCHIFHPASQPHKSGG